MLSRNMSFVFWILAWLVCMDWKLKIMKKYRRGFKENEIVFALRFWLKKIYMSGFFIWWIFVTSKLTHKIFLIESVSNLFQANKQNKTKNAQLVVVLVQTNRLTSNTCRLLQHASRFFQKVQNRHPGIHQTPRRNKQLPLFSCFINNNIQEGENETPKFYLFSFIFLLRKNQIKNIVKQRNLLDKGKNEVTFVCSSFFSSNLNLFFFPSFTS